MEGLLEANRIAEVSLSKLDSCRNGGLPLKRTLLVSKVLNKAQAMATSAHTSLLKVSPFSTSERCTSKLLASFGQDPDTIDGLPVSSPRAALPGTVVRPKSPIALEPMTNNNEHYQSDEESMDFENVSSVLSSILSDTEFEDNSFVHEHLTVEGVSSELSRDSWLDCDTGIDNSWQETLPTPPRPVSPGKRNYQEAFPMVRHGCEPYDMYEDSKRFKASSSESVRLESVPGFCAYLSSKNLQTAPFITYMFGKGFSEPSNPSGSSGWPEKYELLDAQSKPFPSLHSSAHSAPILAF